MKKSLPRVVLAVLLSIWTFGEPTLAGERAHPPAPPAANRPVLTYAFVHYEGCTGACNFIVVGNRKIPIAFSADSARDAVKLLWALKPEILLANTQATSRRLYVVGQLLDGRFRDPVTREAYRAFRLQRWFLVPPFLDDGRYGTEAAERRLGYSGDGVLSPIGDRKPVARMVLRRSDFEIRGEISIDLQALVSPAPR